MVNEGVGKEVRSEHLIVINGSLVRKRMASTMGDV